MTATSRFVPAPSFRGTSPALGGVTPSWLEARLGQADLRILDVRAGAPSAYVRGHIPGAVPLDGHADVHVLEGGFARWIGEGRAVSREIVRHPPASFTAKVSP